MKWVDSIILAFYTLALLGVGIFLTALALEFVPAAAVIQWTEQVTTIEADRWRTAFLGLLLTLLALSTLNMLRQRARKERHIVYKTEGGPIQVSVHALDELVRDIGQEFLDVKNLKPFLKIRKNTIHVRAHLALYAGTQISTIAERIQDRIKTQLETLLGSDVKVSVAIVVKHVDRKSQSRTRQTQSEHSMQFGQNAQ